MMRDVGRVLAATLGYIVLQGLTGALLLRSLPPFQAPHLEAWAAFSALLIAAVMVVLGRHLARGWARPAVLAAVACGLHEINLLEAGFFALAIPRPVLWLLVLSGLVNGVGLALIVHALAGAGAATGPRRARAAGAWATRLLATDLGYVATYFTAGVAIAPYVLPFYGDHVPPFGAIIAMQVFRGLVLSGIVVLLAERCAGGRGRHALLSALAWGVIGGVAPLLIPNPFMPDAVRFAHMVEVGISNPIWAAAAALLLSRARSTPAAALDRAA